MMSNVIFLHGFKLSVFFFILHPYFNILPKKVKIIFLHKCWKPKRLFIGIDVSSYFLWCSYQYCSKKLLTNNRCITWDTFLRLHNGKSYDYHWYCPLKIYKFMSYIVYIIWEVDSTEIGWLWFNHGTDCCL